MTAGYSGTPLAKKLGIKAGFTFLTVNAPDYYYTLFEDFPQVIHVNEGANDVDFIHLFINDSQELNKKLPALKRRLKKDATLWVSWPKKASKVPTTVDESLVRTVGLRNGLVDVKICAIDDTWSGLKFVYRLKDR